MAESTYLELLEATPVEQKALRIVASTMPFLLSWFGLSIEDVDKLARNKLTENEKTSLRETVEKGTPNFTIVIGSRGSGKTTLLRAIEYIHEQAGRRVIYIAPDKLRSEVGREKALDKLKEIIEKEITNQNTNITTLIIDDFTEFLYGHAKSQQEVVEVLGEIFDKIALTRSEETKFKLILAVQSELINEFLRLWFNLEENYVNELYAIFENKKLLEIIHDWSKVIEFIRSDKKIIKEPGFLTTFKFRTRRGMVSDLDVVWYYIKNLEDVYDFVKRFVFAVNDYRINLPPDKLNKLVSCIADYWSLLSITEIVSRNIPGKSMTVKKVLERGAGSLLRDLYNDITRNVEELDNYIQSLNELRSKEVSVYDLNIVSFVKNIGLKLNMVLDEDVQIVTDYKIRFSTERKRGGYRKVDVVLAYEGEPLCMFIAVTAKPKHVSSKSSKKGISVSIPQRVKELLSKMKEHEKLADCYIVLFTYDSNVSQRIEYLALESKVQPISIKGGRLVDPPAYGIIELSELSGGLVKVAKYLIETEHEVKLPTTSLVRSLLHSLRVKPAEIGFIELLKLILSRKATLTETVPTQLSFR